MTEQINNQDTQITQKAHGFSDEEIEGLYLFIFIYFNSICLEFQDAFELFDTTGDGIIKYSQVADLARCFGYDPLDSEVAILLSGDPERPIKKSEMESKSISFEDYLPILWAIAQMKEPGLQYYNQYNLMFYILGTMEDFFEALKVFDKDGEGKVPVTSLRLALIKY